MRKNASLAFLLVLSPLVVNACGGGASTQGAHKDKVVRKHPFRQSSQPALKLPPTTMVTTTPQTSQAIVTSPPVSPTSLARPDLQLPPPTTYALSTITADYWASCSQGVYTVEWSNGVAIDWPVEIPPGKVTVTSNAQIHETGTGLTLPTPLTLTYTDGAEYGGFWKDGTETGAYLDASCSP